MIRQPVMMPRLQPETNENQHHRFAQHIGPPRRGVKKKFKSMGTFDIISSFLGYEIWI